LPASQKKILWSLFSFLLLLAVFSRIQADRRLSWKYPPPQQLIANEFFLNDLGFLLFGARRAAADMGYIQFLQYYGSGNLSNTINKPINFSPVNLARSPFSTKVFDDPYLAESAVGPFPRLLEIFMRIMRLDPFFNSAMLEGGSVLAFNHERFDQSLSLLKEALAWDPGFHRYRLYIAAILYKIQKRDDKLADLLFQAIQYPDCPVLLERVLANLLTKYNRTAEAKKVWEHIAATAPQESDRIDAIKKLQSK